MAGDFHCERCGRILVVETLRGAQPRCPRCGTPAPAGAASASQGTSETSQRVEGARLALAGRIMPWVMSAVLHTGVFLILAFVALMVWVPQKTEAVVVPTVGSKLDQPKPKLSEPPPGPIESPAKGKTEWLRQDSRITLPRDLMRRPEAITIKGLPSGPGTEKVGLPPIGPPGGGGRGPGIFELPFRAHQVVYVVDSSGSMLDTFDAVRAEMFRSITRLAADHSFHVIFFADGPPRESPPRRLVPATEAYKREAHAFLKSIQPRSATGGTNPIPALKRAYEVVRQGGKSRLIFLLTDGEFYDNGKVLETVRALNADGEVAICTLLHHHRSEAASDVLKKIAEMTGGRFKFVSAGE